MTNQRSHTPTEDPAWVGEIEGKYGPAAARISRCLDAMCTYEAVALRYYQAALQGKPLPVIADGVQRSYAWLMGQAVSDVTAAVAANDRFWEYAHRAMVTRIHSAIHNYQRDRNQLGLPLHSSPDEISTVARQSG